MKLAVILESGKPGNGNDIGDLINIESITVI